jgi:hypothetical protein
MSMTNKNTPTVATPAHQAKTITGAGGHGFWRDCSSYYQYDKPIVQGIVAAATVTVDIIISARC